MNRLNNVSLKLKFLNVKIDAYLFNVCRILSASIIFTILFIILEYGYIVAPIVFIIYCLLFEFIFLDLNVIRKNNMLLLDSLDYFRNFLLILKSKKNIVEAIKVTNKTIDNSITKMFQGVLESIRIGKSLDEALNDLLLNLPNDILANIIISLREANIDGNDVSMSIRSQLNLIDNRKNKIIVSYYKFIPFRMGLFSFVSIAIMILVLVLFKIVL